MIHDVENDIGNDQNCIDDCCGKIGVGIVEDAGNTTQRVD